MKINADTIDSWENPCNLTRSFRWVKNGEIVKELTITEDQLCLSRYPICKSCLILRGEIQKMDIQIDRSEKDLPPDYKCLVCDSLYFEHIYCSCGENPHRISCALGFNNYFSLL